MKFSKLCIALLLLIITIGAVSAAEDISDDILSNDENTFNNVFPEIETSNTFTDLETTIENTENVLDINTDYTFNYENDTSDNIIIGKDNFVINGNGHKLDGNSQSRIFRLNGNNITVNNLIFTNGYTKNGGAIFVAGSVTLNNVTFINNNAENGGGIVNIGNVSLTECKFIDNNASIGYAIYSQAGTLNIDNSYFISKYSNKIGSIFASDTETTINNCIFTNTTSKYAPAIYVKSATKLATTIINNTKFINLRASETAGAVAIKITKKSIIENCEFENTRSEKNGGAVFVDIAADAGYTGAVEVLNTTFTNASSGFGGAYLQLNGNLTMSDTTFTNNCAEYNGGALYLSKVIAIIDNASFNLNNVKTYDEYPTYGGGLFFDGSILSLTNSQFNNNTSPIGGGAYIYDTTYELVNVSFNNNGNAIYTIFDDEDSEYYNLTGNDEILPEFFNNAYYPTVIAGADMNMTVLNNNIDVTTLPARFDLREWNWVSPVRNQGSMGACWAFGMTATLESAILKSLGINDTDFSENNMQNSMLIYSQYGGGTPEGGFNTMGIAYLLNWFGAFPQGYDTYDELGKISPLIMTAEDIHIQDVVIVPRDPTIVGGDPSFKQAILKYGALAGYYVGTSRQDEEYPYYNEETHAQYNPNYEISNHAICVVGWDDNYPKENFLIEPEGDGAWIIKNSWGTEWGDEGYVYVSYYDKTFCAFPDQIMECGVAIVIENTMPYNKNYQYDFSGLTAFNYYTEDEELYGTPITYVNCFEAEEEDILAAVGTYFNQAGVNYTIQIEVNGEVALTQNGVSPYYGYHTIKLNQYIPIKEGDEFSIYISSNAIPYSTPARVHYEEEISFSDYGGEMMDIYEVAGIVACIKAYTLEDNSKLSASNLAMDYNDGSCFKVTVTDWDGKLAGAGKVVTFKINGKTYTEKTNSKGVAQLKITDVPKKYTITASYLGSTIKKTVNVKQVLKSAKTVNVKKSAKKLVLKATLKTSKGKAIKSKTVTFKFNGKTYKAKTNSKGIAKVTIKQNVIKKLKKGKTYTVKVTYIKDTIKTSVKVKK